MKIRIKHVCLGALLVLISIAVSKAKGNERDSLIQAEIKRGAKLITQYQQHNQQLRQKSRFAFQKYVIDEFVTTQEGKLRRPGGYITDEATQRLNEVLSKVNLLTGAEVYVLIAPAPPLPQNLAMTREEQIDDLKDQLKQETIKVTKAIAKLADLNASKDSKSGVVYFRLGTVYTQKDEIYNLILSAVLGYYLEELAFGEKFNNFIDSNESEAFHTQTWNKALNAKEYWRDQLYKDNVIKGYTYVFLRLLLNAYRGADVKPIPKVDPGNLLAFEQNDVFRSIKLKDIPRKDLNFFINGLKANEVKNIYNELRLHLEGVLRQRLVRDVPFVKAMEAKSLTNTKPQVVKKLIRNVNTPKSIGRGGARSGRGGYIWIVLVAYEGYTTYREMSEDKKGAIKALNASYQKMTNRWKSTNQWSGAVQKLYQGTITDLEAYKLNFYYYLKIYQRFLNLYYTGEKNIRPQFGEGMACRVRRIIDPHNPKLAQHRVVKKARRDGLGIFDFEDNLNLVPYLDDIMHDDEPEKQPQDWQPTLIELLNQIPPNAPNTGLTDDVYYYEELKKILVAVKVAYQEFFQQGEGLLEGDKPLTQKLKERFTNPFGTDFLRRIREVYSNFQNSAKGKKKRQRMADLQVKKQKLEREGKELSASEKNELWELETYFELLKEAHSNSISREDYLLLKVFEKKVYSQKELNLNDDDAVGNFVIYTIYIGNIVHKFGKANKDETHKVVNPYTNEEEIIPTRIQQQIRKLRREYKLKVSHKIIHQLGYTTTERAKEVEDDYIFGHYYVNKEVPKGNQDSFTPAYLRNYLKEKDSIDPHNYSKN